VLEERNFHGDAVSQATLFLGLISICALFQPSSSLISVLPFQGDAVTEVCCNEEGEKIKPLVDLKLYCK